MRSVLSMSLAFALALSAATIAQDQGAAPPAMTPEQQAAMAAYQRMGEVRAEHRRLAEFDGTWTTETTLTMDPSAPPQKSAGKATYSTIWGGRYSRTTFEGDMMGAPFTGEGITGFDNLKGKYFTTWMDSMSTGYFIAWGDYDAASKTYTFRGETDDPLKPGTVIPIRAVTKVVDASHHTFTWFETRDGKETKTMEITYTKQ